MAIAILTPLPFAISPTLSGSPVVNSWIGGDGVSFNGDTDGGVCIKTLNDGKDVTVTDSIPIGLGPWEHYFQDDAVIPLTAAIDSVVFRANLRGTDIDVLSPGIGPFFLSNGSGGTPVPFTTGTLGAAYSILTTDVLTVNPATGLAWARADLFNDGDAGGFGNGAWAIVKSPLIGGATFGMDYADLIVTYTGAITSNWYFNPLSGHFQFSATDPGAPWVLSSAPVIDLVSVTPSKGPAAGGTPVVLKGSGFGDGAIVTFGGTAATAVDVVNDNTITCTTPAHAEGVVDVTVTNADATSGTLVHGYAYIIELTLSVDTTAIFADGDATAGLTMGVDVAFAAPAILDLTTPPDVILGPSVSLDTTTAMTPASAGSNAGGTDLPLVIPGPGAPTDPANPAASQHWWGLQRFDVKPRLEEHK